MKYRRMHASRQKPATWAGLLLGFLLTIFVIVFVYVAMLFMAWGRATVASVPEMPALSLPKLVRAAPAGAQSGEAQPNEPQQSAAPQNARPQEPATAERRVTLLLMGVDNRPNERVEATRTDTIMVLTVNPETGAAGMLSMPRDLLIDVPALGRQAKINTLHVYGYLNNYPGGGPMLLKDTLSGMIGYPIDYYVRLNFDGFRQIVDLVGGIDIDVPKDIHDPLYPDNNYGYEGFDIKAGHHHMDGTLALKYARTRHADSDYGRADRQQQVILAIKEKLLQPGQLAALLPRLPGLALALSSSVQTDMPIDRAIALARALDKADLKNPARVVVDNTFGTQEPNNPDFGFVLRADPVKLKTAAAAIFADTPAAVSAEEELKAKLKTERARIVVLNGSPEEGLATKTAEQLSREGFNVIAIGNAEAVQNPKTSLITYGDTSPVTREALLRRFAITPDRIRSEPPSPDADLAVVLGNDAGGMSPAN